MAFKVIVWPCRRGYLRCRQTDGQTAVNKMNVVRCLSPGFHYWNWKLKLKFKIIKYVVIVAVAHLLLGQMSYCHICCHKFPSWLFLYRRKCRTNSFVFLHGFSRECSHVRLLLCHLKVVVVFLLPWRKSVYFNQHQHMKIIF